MKHWIFLCLTVGASLLSAQTITYLASKPNVHAFEFVAHGDQTGDSATTYGYLSRVNGIDSALLFATTAATQTRSEVNAKLTVVSKLTFTDRFVNGNMIVGVQDETMTIYFTDAPTARDFAKPDTFTQGTVVATFHDGVQTVLNVQTPLSVTGPGRGIVLANTQGSQDSGTVFTLSGERYVLGQIGMPIRMVATGQGTLTSASPFVATFLFGGFAESRPFFRF